MVHRDALYDSDDEIEASALHRRMRHRDGCWYRNAASPFSPYISANTPRVVRRIRSIDFVRYDPPTKALFAALVPKWREDAALHSISHRVALMPAYQEMIGLGSEALPLILDRLKTDPSSHWFWALKAIGRQDAAKGTSTVSQAVEAWLGWGHSRGLVAD